jgi:hypothetical protein
MIVLGGWLFADLLLGLAMLFAVANTVGAPPPTPTPTPAPDYLATAESDLAMQQASSEQTAEALRDQVAAAELAAEQTAEADATRAAMSDSEQATADARATEDAVVAQATIAALSTEQASQQLDQNALNSQLATSVAEATRVAEQVQAQGTEQARLEAQATENAASGVNAQGTMAALQDQIASNESALATSEAESSQAQGQLDSAEATSAAAQSALAQAEQQIQLNSLNPNASVENIQVDLNGVLQGNQGALDDARDELDRVLAKYINGQNCRIGFVNISSSAPDVGTGSDLSERIGQLIEDEFPPLLPQPANGDNQQNLQLAFEAIALPGVSPSGQVELQLVMSAGCQPAG